MTSTDTESPDALLRRLAMRALHRAERAANTAERIGWLARFSELMAQANDLVTVGGD